MPRRSLPGPVAADLVLSGFDEVATLAGPAGPRAGPDLADVGLLTRGAVAADHGRIVWVGPEVHLRTSVRLRPGATERNFPGGLALPGFVDAHTHVLFAGSRERELPRKIRGESYAAIAASGGGLFQTVRETRAASSERLFTEAAARLLRMRRWGTTSAEVKSGYALDLAGELKLLRLVPRLARTLGMTLVPTLLGAHAYPPESVGDPERYLRLVLERMIPEAARLELARFVDVFCEPGFFDPRATERVLREGSAHGLGGKVHAEEFVHSGGARVAARCRAVSADHLLEASARDRSALREAGVLPVLLPVTPLASLSGTHAPGRALADEGLAVALGSDCSPNSWVESMPAVVAHAVHSARLTPAEAIVAATVNAAYASGLGGEAGELRPGRAADLVVFDLPGFEHLAYRWGTEPPSAVFLRGRDALAHPSPAA